MSSVTEYYYNHQLRNYLVQFMAIFAGLQVEVGKRDDVEPTLISVPVYSGSKDRVVAAIKAENTQNKPIRLPTMSAHLVNLELAPERRHGTPVNRRESFMPSGGLFPDDISVVEQRMPVPYNATYELSIWASNQDQHYQILEQILMLFNPILQIQTSDELFDWTKITTVELAGIGLEENYPSGGDRRVIQTTLTFIVPIWVATPADLHRRFVEDIFVRIGVVSQAARDSRNIIAELDSQGVEYELNFSLDSIDLEGSDV